MGLIVPIETTTGAGRESKRLENVQKQGKKPAFPAKISPKHWICIKLC